MKNLFKKAWKILAITATVVGIYIFNIAFAIVGGLIVAVQTAYHNIRKEISNETQENLG